MSVLVIAALAAEVLLCSALATAAIYRVAFVKSVWALLLLLILGMAIIVGPLFLFQWQTELMWKTNPFHASVVCVVSYYVLFAVFSNCIALPRLRRERSAIAGKSEPYTPEFTKRVGYALLALSGIFCGAGVWLMRRPRLPADPFNPHLLGWVGLVSSLLLFLLTISALIRHSRHRQ